MKIKEETTLGEKIIGIIIILLIVVPMGRYIWHNGLFFTVHDPPSKADLPMEDPTKSFYWFDDDGFWINKLGMKNGIAVRCRQGSMQAEAYNKFIAVYCE